MIGGQARSEPTRTVAAFDFDGTLARGDSLLGFLRLICGPLATALALASQGGPAVSALARGQGMERDVAKAAILARLLAGRPLDDLKPLAQTYAQRLVARIRPEMRATLERHQAAGHDVVIVSASPELYLGRVGQALGVDAVLATRLEVGPDGRLTGALDGPNCRGPEKTARLLAWLDQASGDGRARAGASAYLHAYGNSAGDAELLALADVPVWVGRRPGTRPGGGRHGTSWRPGWR